MAHLFEESLREELLQQLRKLESNDVFIDVGACVGTSCLLLEKGRCFAFECDPEAVQELKNNVLLNPTKDVMVIEKAVSDREFNYVLHRKDRLGDSYLTMVDDANAEKTITLDDYFRGYTNIKLIKVDAEGQDYNVLLGAERILRNNRPVVVVEAWNAKLDSQITSFLRKLGYSIVHVGINIVGEFLSSKYHLEITTMSRCSVDCSFCPQKVYQKAYGEKTNLSLIKFKSALTNVPKNVIIEFAGFSEPFLNPECIDMICYADSEGYRVIIDTTLTGLNPDGIAKIAGCDLVAFTLHLPDNKNNTKILFNTQNYKDTLVACLTKIRVTSFVTMNDDFVSNERAGNCTNTIPRNLKGKISCKLNRIKFPHPVMIPNGDLVLCCMDYGLIHPLGNLFCNSYDKLTLPTKVYAGNLCRRCKFAESPLKSFKSFINELALSIYKKIRFE